MVNVESKNKSRYLSKYMDAKLLELLSIKDFKNKHLFVIMFDFRDRWIEKNGDLTPTHLLARP